ncbi:MAG TPA: MogA/MoaB family molybdenum cofactor biosynthesis protein [Bacillota bacterium]
MAVEEHRRRAAARVVQAVVVTVSDTRGPDDDAGGALIEQMLAAAGHRVLARRFVPDEVEAIRGALQEALAMPGVDAVLLTGGTGIAPRDRTPEAVRPLLDRELPGFGEIFRMLSYQEVGAAGMLSRALAGAAGRCFVGCLPGSPKAVRLAMERLILPEIRHIINELRRGG